MVQILKRVEALEKKVELLEAQLQTTDEKNRKDWNAEAQGRTPEFHLSHGVFVTKAHFNDWVKAMLYDVNYMKEEVFIPHYAFQNLKWNVIWRNHAEEVLPELVTPVYLTLSKVTAKKRAEGLEANLRRGRTWRPYEMKPFRYYLGTTYVCDHIAVCINNILTYTFEA